MKIKSHSFTLPFLKKEHIAKNTFAFYFDRSKENWQFHPGQYVQMMLPHNDADQRGTMRYFTISSSPLDTKHLRIITKIMDSSFKKYLFGLKKGQDVSFRGPNGDFYLQEKKLFHVFLAGGIGITPFISMLEYAAEKKLQNNITLIVVFFTIDEIIFYDKLTQISNDHPNLKVIYAITHHENTFWKGETGSISPGLIKKHVPDIAKPLYYITGSPSMVEATVVMLQKMKIPEDHIFQEHFSGY